MFAIIEVCTNFVGGEEIDELFYLNHSQLNTMSFGSLDMAWTTINRKEAEKMLERVQEKHKEHGKYHYSILNI